jgi:xylulokinase
MGQVLLGIDIGTSSCKAAAFDENGRVLAQENSDYKVYYPHPGWAEQNPEDWWKAACSCIKSIIEGGRVSPKDIAGIGIDGQSWSAIAVDGNGRVLTNTPIWMDTRADKICQRISDTIGEDRLFKTSGNPLQPSYAMPKILWYKEHLPDVYKAAVRILQSNSFIGYRLTGAITQDMSQGYGFGCYNIEKGQWDKELCRELGIDPWLLPPIVQSFQIIGGVTREAALSTGLLEGTPVAAGGLDAACGALGTGVIHPGETQEQGGQAGGMSICMDTCRADKRLILGNHVVPGLWLLQGGTVGGGGVIGWFEREFCSEERAIAKLAGENTLQVLDREAAQIAPGSDGLIFLPYMAGERSPIWNPKAKGVYFGADFSKTRAHFARASMEGVAYSLRHNLQVAREAGANCSVLRSMGGAASSRLWTQMKSDVTGKEIIVPSAGTATALGAAILAGVGTGLYSSFQEAADRTISVKAAYVPNKENSDVYHRGYERYLKLYENLKEMMGED